MNRRDFLVRSAAAAGVMMTSSHYLFGAEGKEKPFRLALLSDTHIPENPPDGWNGYEPIPNFEKVVAHVIQARPDAAVINGDVARLKGTVGDYRKFKELLKPMSDKLPVFINLGNHDHRNNFYEVFPEVKNDKHTQDVAKKHVTVIEGGGCRLIILDSLFHVNDGAGLLGKNQRTWLENFLDQESTIPTILVLHHTLGDGDYDLLDSDRLFKLLAARKQVKAIVFGHSHRYGYSKHEDIHLINLPAIGYVFDHKQPIGWLDTTLHKNGMSLTLDAVAAGKSQHRKQVDLKWLR
ncbi:3',5'-cyclic adenosine monophosphate phosphodiesterase CpdA [Rubritalea halochordaticola]|uniref:3',5'-cyclic adenosine monophosphate phosphodiesterase CpdA n=1 Tax=Rubritalea halochordaticola TaxID=714537 RepID=A0ABP9V6Q1_9BACT